MRNDALLYRRFGPPGEVLALESQPLGPPEPGRVRVRMIAAPVNPSDLIPVTGAYGHRVRPPLVAGYEGVGAVVGSGGALAEGTRVLPLRGPGTWQRVVDADPAWLVAVPDDIPTELAARAYINPLSAQLMLEAWPVAGRRVLLTAAGSACAGLLALWAFAAGARSVTGIVRSAAHGPALAALGVEPVTMADTAAVTAAAARAEVAFDAVGGPLAEAILDAMPPGGDFVSYGLLSGQPFAVPAVRPALRRFHLRDRLATVAPETWQGWFRTLWPRLRRAPLPGVATVPLAEWRRALALFHTAGRRDKPLLVMG
ncbi:zinc-dependent alcohol dehydrogenase family protein [Azospirillum sp. RWY-5-1]|uniref:Zinc-dependent alcohol dehydrogenase family protein n=1 Tax=Azospirillum oleiclasticum TaxID=2735135 RepID=A0ABX2TIQ3_9PROT|nr:zinc-dependent alcohol dehydrogenase family protein [Azospirillum oleiclasticum]NYZ24221.1 zinc-dependent alcohol dehydrogenase family protein [Azospirillum oleiclasticum]